MPSVFTRIIDGQLPGHFVWRDDAVVGFLSINPLSRGHTLVVPRREVDHWIDADDELTARLFTAARKIAAGVQAAFEPVKVGMMVAGLEVPHLHIHLVPIAGLRDLDFDNAASSVPAAELVDNAAKIRAALTELGYEQASD